MKKILIFSSLAIFLIMGAGFVCAANMDVVNNIDHCDHACASCMGMGTFNHFDKHGGSGYNWELDGNGHFRPSGDDFFGPHKENHNLQ